MGILEDNLERMMNGILKNVYIYVFFIGILLIFIAVWIGRKKRRIKRKTIFSHIIKGIKFPLHILITLLKPKGEEAFFKKRTKLKKVYRNLSIDQFYFAKIVFPLFIFALLLSLYKTNLQYTTREIIENMKGAPVDITTGFWNFQNVGQDRSFLSSPSKDSREEVEREWEYYAFLKKKGPSMKQILSAPKEAVIESYQQQLMKEFSIEETEALYTAKRIYYKTVQIAQYQFNEKYYIVILLSYFLPDLMVFLMTRYREHQYKRDIPILKMAAYLMGSMDVTVREILESLKETSSTYRDVFSNALSNMNAVQLGRENAILQMAEEVPDVQFRKLCVIMKDMAIRDRKRALKNLEEDMRMEAKENMMRSEDKIEKKTWIAILLIVLTMFFLALLLLMPFVKYQQSFHF